MTQKVTNSFSRGAYISDLSVGTYTITATKDDRNTWTKQMKVLPQKVTEGHPFLLPQTMAFSTTTSTSTIYKTVSLLFASSTHPTLSAKVSTSSTTTLLTALSKKNIDLNKTGDTIYAVWLAEMEDIPFYFCGQDFIESQCTPKLAVVTAPGIKSFDFYPGRTDLLIFSKADGVYVTELDTRSPQNTQLLMKGSNLDFRVQNGQDVYIKNKTNIYKLEL
jgi:hypothetical protein